MEEVASQLARRSQPVPVRCDVDEPAPAAPPGSVRPLGRVRLPIAGPYRPSARAYRLPDGRVVWCVRLWRVDRPVRTCQTTSTIRAFCRLNGLSSVEEAVDDLLRR